MSEPNTGVTPRHENCEQCQRVIRDEQEQVVEFSKAYVPRADFDEAVSTIKALEWSSFVMVESACFSACPACRCQQREGKHRPACPLAAFLAKHGDKT